MSDFEDDQFENAGSGASLTYPKQCSALRKESVEIYSSDFSLFLN